MDEREQNLLIAANEIIGDFKQYGEVLQQGDNGEYGTESPIGQLSAAVDQYERAEFTCEAIEGQAKKIRYEVIWCIASHGRIESYHYKYFNGDKADGQVRAFNFAKMLIKKNLTFHGCCSIHEQEAERYSDEHGPFISWKTIKTRECSTDTEGKVVLF